MVTKQGLKPAAATKTIKWEGEESEVLLGANLIEKETIIGRMFRITGYKFSHNSERNIGYVWVEIEFEPNGERSQFNDSSAGVRAQMETYHESKGVPMELDHWWDVKILCPQGLRVFEFDTTDEKDRPVKGRRFYLTTSGGRA